MIENLWNETILNCTRDSLIQYCECIGLIWNHVLLIILMVEFRIIMVDGMHRWLMKKYLFWETIDWEYLVNEAVIDWRIWNRTARTAVLYYEYSKTGRHVILSLIRTSEALTLSYENIHWVFPHRENKKKNFRKI